jgi:crotonobetainyl-CoA:carnitine CoA-transferase CaiB-like acyl-CoA transferase
MSWDSEGGTGALAGIRVLDLTRLLPGGLCTLLLADFGADVIKVEAPPAGDYLRSREPLFPGTEPTTASAPFRGLNRNKRSVIVDLKSPDGRAAFLTLAAEADVVVESFRPRVIDRLGIGYPALAAVNQKIVRCSISGWGQSGPLAQVAGHDLNYLAAMGLLSFTGSPEEVPEHPATQVADSASGLYAAFTILAALRQGEGEPYEALALPVRLSRTPPDPARRPVPALGADTAELLGGATPVTGR